MQRCGRSFECTYQNTCIRLARIRVPVVRDEPLDAPSREAVADAVESTLGWTVTGVRGFERGLNAVYRIDRDTGDPAVLKTATLATDEQRLVEAALLSRLGDETDVPFPEVYATFEPDETPLGMAAFVMEYCDGREVTNILELSPAAQERLLAESGRHLAVIHDARIVDGFGPLGTADGRLVVDPRYGTWDEWFRQLVEETLDGLQGDGFTTDSDSRFADLATEIRETLLELLASANREPDPAILFGDYRPANLVLAPDERAPVVRAVIDIDAAPTADGLLDLALTEDALVGIPFGGTERAEPLRNRLRRRYCRARNVDRSTLGSDWYTAYTLYARTRRLGAFDYWVQFAHEEDRDAAARRWRAFVRDRLRELG